MQNSNSNRNRTSRVDRIDQRYKSSLSAIEWAIRRAERYNNFERAGGLRARRNAIVRSREAAIAIEEERLATVSRGALPVHDIDPLVVERPSVTSPLSNSPDSLTDRISSINLADEELSSVQPTEQSLSLRRFLLDRDLLQVSQTLAHWTLDPSDLLDFTIDLNFSQTGVVRGDLRVQLRSIASLISEIRAVLLDESPPQDE